MRADQLLADRSLLIMLCSSEVDATDPDRRKGHGVHKCKAHGCCRDWHHELVWQGGTRNEQLIHEVRMYHPEVTLGIVLGPGRAAQDVDSIEGRAQLIAAEVDQRDYLTIQTPGGPNNIHVYGALPKRGHLRALLGCDIREGRVNYMLAPGWFQGVNRTAKYKIISGRWGVYQTFPETMLTSSMLPPAAELDTPSWNSRVVGKEWYAQDHLGGDSEHRIGHWDVELAWRFQDDFGGLSMSQRIVRAYVIQAVQRHRRTVVDVGQVAVAKATKLNQSTVSRSLAALLNLGALQQHSDDERGELGYISPRTAAASGGRSLTKSYSVPGLTYRVTDVPLGHRLTSPYGRGRKA